MLSSCSDRPRLTQRFFRAAPARSDPRWTGSSVPARSDPHADRAAPDQTCEKAWMMLMAAGPTTTTNMAGMMQKAMGTSILTGAL